MGNWIPVFSGNVLFLRVHKYDFLKITLSLDCYTRKKEEEKINKIKNK
jgi:hypothetical protein